MEIRKQSSLLATRRQIVSLLSAILLLPLLSACSTEELEDQGGSLFGEIPPGTVCYQFKLTGISPSVIYSGNGTGAYAPVATENELAINDLAIFLFEEKKGDQDNAQMFYKDIYQKPKTRSSITLAETRVKRSGNIILKNNVASMLIPKEMVDALIEYLPAGQKLRFVILANTQLTNASWNGWYPGNPTNIDITDYRDLASLNSVWISQIGNQYVRSSYATTLPPGGGLAMQAVVKDVPLMAPGDVLKIAEVRLQRAVARIDIRNSAVEYMKIKQIGLLNCRTTAPLFALNSFVDDPGDRRLMIADDESTAVQHLNDPNFTDPANPDTLRYEEGIFYPHPNKPEDNLQLVIEAEVDLGVDAGGVQTATYVLPVKTELKANTRYRIDITMNKRDADPVIHVKRLTGEWGKLEE